MVSGVARNILNINTVSGTSMHKQSQASSAFAPKSPDRPLYQGTRFSGLGTQDHIGAVHRRPLDANDIRFNFATLIMDENDKIDRDIKEKQRAETKKIDPFMKEFLARGKG